MNPHDLRVLELEKFIRLVEIRCKERLITFKKDQLPGSKRDFIFALKASSILFENKSEATIEKTLKELNCKFPNGGRVCANDKTIRNIFKEIF